MDHISFLNFTCSGKLTESLSATGPRGIICATFYYHDNLDSVKHSKIQ